VTIVGALRLSLPLLWSIVGSIVLAIGLSIVAGQIEERFRRDTKRDRQKTETGDSIAEAEESI
jgi:hypothetical protein